MVIQCDFYLDKLIKHNDQVKIITGTDVEYF